MVDTAAALTGSSRNLLATSSQDADQNENPIGGAFEVEGSSNPEQRSSAKSISMDGTGTIVDDISDVGGSPDVDFMIADDDGTAGPDLLEFQVDTPTSTAPDDGAEPMITRDDPSES